MIYNHFMEFSEYISREYVKWRGDATGRQKSESAFARLLGVKQPTFNTWKLGTHVPTSQKEISKLVDYFGPVIYEILNIETPVIQKTRIPRSIQRRIDKAIQETNDELIASDQAALDRDQAARLALIRGLADKIDSIPGYLSGGNPQEINRLLSLLLSKIIVNDNKIELIYR